MVKRVYVTIGVSSFSRFWKYRGVWLYSFPEILLYTLEKLTEWVNATERVKTKKSYMQALNSNVIKLTLNIKARSRNVTRATPCNIKYIIMKAIIHYFSLKC